MKRIVFLSIILIAMLLSACATSASNPQKSVTTNFLIVMVDPPEGGSVSPPGGTFETGTQVTLTATPASGYTFNNWEGAASSSSPTITLTVNANKTITAYFKKQ